MSVSQMYGPPPGWYPDPVGRSRQRYWSGGAWTAWVSNAGEVASDPGPVRRHLTAADTEHLAFVRDLFIPEARALGLIEDDQTESLVALTRTLGDQACPQFRTPLPVARPAQPAAWQYGGADIGVQGATAPRAGGAGSGPTGAFGRWWERSRQTIGSDLVTHGLAYLGVLMLFVGAFGLVAFAFGDVAPNARPVAELAIAATPFLAAAMLLRRGAEIAGRAMELAGGLLVPIMAATTFVDGVDVPPDLAGTALVLALTLTLLGVSVAYAGWTSRHPSSALRFLVAPVAWLAAAMAVLGVGRAVPSGDGVAAATAAQVTAMSAAIVLSLVVARVKPSGRLSGPSMTAAVPGVAITALLAVLTWSSESWPVVPIAVTGILGLLALDLLEARLPAGIIAVTQSVWWALVALALSLGLESWVVGAFAAVGFVVLIENNGRRRPAAWPLGLAAAGLVIALGVTWTAPWWAFTMFAVMSVWAIYRRLAPFAVVGCAEALDLAAALLPTGAVIALGFASERAVMTVAAAAGLVALSTVPAVRPVLRRGVDDVFWTRWWSGGLVGVVALAAVLAGAFPQEGLAEQWLLTVSVAALAASAALGPISPIWRPWPVLTLATWSWFLACATMSVPDALRGGLAGAVGLGLVGAAHADRRRVAPPLAGSVGLAGHALTLVALGAAGTGWGLVIVTGLTTAGFLVTTWFDSRGQSSVGTLLSRPSAALGFLPPTLAALGLPLTVALALDAGGILLLADPAASTVSAATALVYAAAVRRAQPGRVSLTLAWVAFAAGVLASVGAQEARPAAIGLASLMVAVTLLPTRLRSPAMVWVAWAALAPFMGLLALEALPWLADQSVEFTVAATLVAVGGVMVIAVAVADLRGRPWEARPAPSSPGLIPVLVTGGAEVVLGLQLALTAVPIQEGGWLTAALAIIVLALAALSRVGVLAGVAGTLGWLATLMLAGETLGDAPWISIAATAAFLVAAELTHRILADRRWWARLDAPLLVVAHLTALTALVVAVGGADFATTAAGVGVLALAVSLRLRSIAFLAVSYAAIGWVLVVVGAAVASPGWLALALLALSAALTISAARGGGAVRGVLQVGGAVAATGAWLAALVWFSWATQASVDITAVSAAAVALAWALVSRLGAFDRSWAMSWGSVAVSTATVLAAYAALSSAWGGQVEVSQGTSFSLFLVAVALAVAAAPLSAQWLRDVAALYLFAAVLQAMGLSAMSSGWQEALLATISIVCAAVLATLATSSGAERPFAQWRRPLTVLGLATNLAAIAVGMAALPDTALLVPGLLVAAAWSATLGIVLRSNAALVFAPLFACTAWIVFAADALAGSAQWYTVPIGLTLLVVVALVRRDARGRGRDPSAASIVALEMVGIAFVVGAALVQSVTTSLVYTAVALALGLAIGAWGVVTKVRRRVAAGVAIVVAAMVLLVALPLVQLLPAWSSALLWACIAGVGILALLAATLLEQGRSVVRRVLKGFGELTEGWE